MNPKIYLVLGVLCIVAIFASMGLLGYFMFSIEDPFEQNIFLYFFGWFVVSAGLMFLTGFFFVKYNRQRAPSYGTQMTKRCVSCGENLNATDLSCHRCHTLQPIEEKGYYRK